jgi:hypothetical protein
MILLTAIGKSPEEIARDFDNNVELVCAKYAKFIAMNLVYRNATDGTWVVLDNGKKWTEKYYTI